MSKKKTAAIEVDGEQIHTTVTRVRTDVDTGGPRLLHKGETFSAVVRATVSEWTLRTLRKKDTRVQVGIGSRAVIVDDELAEDVLQAHEEFTTGQMRLLSLEGEDRRAARMALGRLRSLREDKGFTPESDDGVFKTPWEFLDQAVKAHGAGLTGYTQQADDMGAVAYLEACEEELTQAAATLLAGVTYCRRALGRHHENEARAKQVTVDGAGTAMTEDEVAAQREKAAGTKKAGRPRKAAAKAGKAKDGGLEPRDDGGL